MKGLMIKDLMLLRNQAKTMLLIIGIGICMFFGQGPEMVVSYITLVSGMLALSSLSYDEFDNGFAHLLTLPASRRTYVVEKYVFGFCWIFFSAVLGSVCGLAASVFFSKTEAPSAADFGLAALMMVIMMLLMLALSFPLRLKYGSEKGKTALYLVLGLIALGAVAASAMVKKAGPLPEGPLNRLSGWLIPAVGAVTLVLYLVSFLISVRIMEKKEF